MGKRRAQQTALFAEPQPLRPVTPQARAMCSRGNKAAPAPKPWECVLCVVDTAKVSGWAIGARGVLHGTGQHDTERYPDLTARVVERATSLGKLLGLPVVLVLEAPYGGHKHPGMVPMIVALGVAKGRWLDAWKRAGQAAARKVTVQPSVWRGPVLGSWAVSLARNEVRKAELSMARGIVGREDVGPDEAAAVCIHHWAAHAPKVGEVIGAKALRKSMAAWTRRAGGAR
jgi:hypothetical protein